MYIVCYKFIYIYSLAPCRHEKMRSQKAKNKMPPVEISCNIRMYRPFNSKFQQQILRKLLEFFFCTTKYLYIILQYFDQ